MYGRTVILASGSPRRRELLARMGVRFIVDAADVDEACEGAAEDVVRVVARRKVLAVAARHPGGTVLAADTVVDCEGILGKPRDAEEAAAMLRRLAGRWHTVYTGVCVVGGTDVFDGVAQTRVRFIDVLDADIARYVATGDPMDKAGAYAIQGMAGMFIDRVEGCPHNVMGLPLALTKALLERAWRATEGTAVFRT